MSSNSVMASSDAYVKTLLHCYKHSTQPVLGMLVGKHLKNNSNNGSEDSQSICYVVDAIPLFHTTHMAYPHPMIDVAFAHAQSAALTKGLSVVGVYYAPDRLNDHSVSTLLKSVLDYVYTRLGGDAPLLVWFVDNTTLLSPPQALSVTSFSYSKDGANTYQVGQAVPPPSEAPSAQRLSFGRWNSDTLQAEPSGSAESAVEAVGSALYAFAQYRIIDFEDHLEDPRLNYLDQALTQLIRR